MKSYRFYKIYKHLKNQLTIFPLLFKYFPYMVDR